MDGNNGEKLDNHQFEIEVLDNNILLNSISLKQIDSSNISESFDHSSEPENEIISHRLLLKKPNNNNWSIVRLQTGDIVVQEQAQSSQRNKICPLCGSAVAKFNNKFYQYFQFLAELYHQHSSNYEQTYSDFKETSNESIPQHFVLNKYYSTFFKEIKKLGSGAYGQVYLCVHILDGINLGYYAIKKIPVGDSRDWLNKMIKEVKVREFLNHQNVVSYKHSWLEIIKGKAIDSIEVPWLFVLMEYCEGGSLEDLVETTYKVEENILSDIEIWVLFFDIIIGLQHLHHKGIIHRDLKPSNIMLKINREVIAEGCEVNQVYACLADFGTAGSVYNQRSGFGFTGTMEYTAPELLKKDIEGNYSAAYNFSNDIWSCGWILYYLAYGTIPIQNHYEREFDLGEYIVMLVDSMKRRPFNPCDIPFKKNSNFMYIYRPLEMRQFISNLLHPVPKYRPNCDTLLKAKHILEKYDITTVRKLIADKMMSTDRASTFEHTDNCIALR